LSLAPIREARRALELAIRSVETATRQRVKDESYLSLSARALVGQSLPLKCGCRHDRVVDSAPHARSRSSLDSVFAIKVAGPKIL
jgi:hypothetical protein